MRAIYVLVLLFSVEGFGQTRSTICKPDSDIKVATCGSNFIKDSICPACYECRPRLISLDSNYSIINYSVKAWGKGFGDGIEEATSESRFFEGGKIRSIISKAGKGSFIQFDCIRAMHKNGLIHVLQPLLLEL